MKCPNCGKQNPEDVIVCVGCGANLKKDSQLDQTMSFLLPNEVLEEDKTFDLDKLTAEGPALVVIRGRSIGETFSLSGDEILIGRDPANDIFLDDITVSRNHAKITTDGEMATIADVGSLNGTYVNRTQIEEAKLEDRDEIQIGKFKLFFLSRKIPDGRQG